MSEDSAEVKRTGLEAAVIGMAGRFPGADNIHQFWDNLKNGVESIVFFSHEELEKEGIAPDLLKDPDYVKANGVLDNIEYFDSFFFKYFPMEAAMLNPQIRVLMECAWEALENAGYNPWNFDGLIGFYAGASSSFYWQGMAFLSGQSRELGQFAASNLVDKDFLSTQISYKFNLKGPSVVVQTTCSTSLVAIHLAYRAVLTGECHMALAGGAAVPGNQKQGYLYEKGMIGSPDGHCRAFDKKSNGIIGGSGAGIVVLKRLKEAINARDTIYAVIKGSAINNDGKEKVGFTAPSVEGQQAVIRTAQAMARVEPESIGYIETHGTGTALGDPVEIEALRLAFNTGKKNFCALGSVKTNVGHLDAAAGVTGFIKTVLTLNQGCIPPSLHFEIPNPEIDFDNSPFYVNTRLRKWESNGFPRRAGINSFGIGGTNAHVILEQALEGTRGLAPLPDAHPSRDYQFILLSAKTETALEKMTQNLAKHFKKNPDINLPDAAYTLQVGRRALEYRQMLVCTNIEEAVAGLTALESGGLQIARAAGQDERNVVFMFPGQGSQYENMGRELYEKEPIFREELDLCFEILKSLTDHDIKGILYPGRGEVSSPAGEAPAACNPHLSLDINQTEIAQPVIFIFEYALAKLLMKWGIKPSAMIGHSIGEYTAACLAGVFTLEDALAVVTSRGRLMQQMPLGAMLSVPLDEKELIPLSNEELSIAAVNTSSDSVVSGSHQAVNDLAAQLKEKGYETRFLHTSHAFHSKIMDPIMDKFVEKVKQIPLNSPTIPYISNVTGQRITDAEVTDPNYWAMQLRRTVRFYDGLKELLKKEETIFVEVGPGKALSTVVRQHEDRKTGQLAVNFVRHPGEKVPDDYYLLKKIGQLWLGGVKIDWKEFYAAQERYHISLPVYPFERQRYWTKGDIFKMGAQMPEWNSRLNQKKKVEDFFYIPLWKPSIERASGPQELPAQSSWLLFLDECGLGTRLQEKLQANKCQVITVNKGSTFAKIADREFIINPREVWNYQVLIHELCLDNTIPKFIVHLWSLTTSNRETFDEEVFLSAQYLGFYSLLYLVKAINKKNLSTDFQVTVVSNHLQEVTGQEILSPEKSCVLGLLKIIPQEFTNFRCRSIDIDLPSEESRQENKLVNQILRELSGPIVDNVIAFRNNRRWVQFFERVKLEQNSKLKPPLRKGGVYLVTGGIGNLGLELAEYLGVNVQAKLVLTRRSYFPEKAVWDEWLSAHNGDTPTTKKIQKLQGIETLGGEVMLCQADVAHRQQMQNVIQQAEQRFGQINGVIHAAGVVNTKSSQCGLEEISDLECEEQFHPKVHGLIVLDGLFKERELDFFVCTSSLSSILGGLGFTAYCPANIFMDTFFRKYWQTNRTIRISMNWDGWMFGDKAASPGELVLTPEKGKMAFHRILAWGCEPQVVISASDLQSGIDRWIKLDTLKGLDNSSTARESLLQARPGITSLDVKYRSQVEKTLTRIWQTFFGFEKIGIHDDFFELGGGSLHAINILSIIHRELKVSIPLVEFFNRPTIGKLAKYIENADKTAYFSIEPFEKKEHYKLFSAQKRLYFLQQMHPQCTAYNLTEIIELAGDYDYEKMERTFLHLIKKHESLRTSFQMIDEEPVQRIHEKVEFKIEYYDISRVDEEKQTTDNRRQATKGRSNTHLSSDFVRPFDLSLAPLMRVGLLSVSGDKRFLIVDIHHSISDGISHGILRRDFLALYSGEKSQDLKIQYKDYSCWWHCQKAKGIFKEQEQYWQQQFQGDIPVLNLPTDYPRPEEKDFSGSTVYFEISPKETEQLKKMASDEDATLFMVVLAVFNTFLAKLSGQQDIVIGTGTSGRNHADLGQIIGMFVNTLALRNRPQGVKTFRQFLREVKVNTLQAFENQDFPFENLVEKIVEKRVPNRSPLFDVMFQLQTIEPEFGEEVVLADETVGFINRTAKFDLIFDGIYGGKKTFFTVEYSTQLFKKETIEGFSDFFIQLIAQLLHNIDIPLKEVKLFHHSVENQLDNPTMDFDF